MLGGAGWSLGSTGIDADGAYATANDVVFFWARLVFGTVGMAFDAATVPTVSLPVSADASQVAFTPRVGVNCGLFDTSAALEYVAPAELTATLVNLMVVGTNLAHAYMGNRHVAVHVGRVRRHPRRRLVPPGVMFKG